MSVPYRQDMPPAGGFPEIKYKRNLPFRGPSGVVILGGVTAVCAYGFYRVGLGNLEKRELQREKAWSRIHLVPLLLAEGDRDAYRRQQAALQPEAASGVRVLRKSRLWVDDAFTVVSASALIVQITGVFLDPARHGVVRNYLLSNMFYLAIWSARLSILFSLIRITRNLRPTRLLYFIAVLFFLAYAFLMAQLFWKCEGNQDWKKKPIPQCNLGIAVAVCQIVSDVISDSILLLAPIRIFMVITDRKLRYRAMIIFGTCIVTTIVSLVHAAYIFQALDTSILISAFVENSASLVVCNIPIMVTAIVKLQESRGAQSTARSRSIPLFHKPAITRSAHLTGFSTTTDVKFHATQEVSTSTSEGLSRKGEGELITTTTTTTTEKVDDV